MANAERTKNFMFIVYPDNKNMVENWREVIQDYGHKAFISPIHDKDTYEKDVKNDNGEIIHHKGDLKKAHYHVCVCRSTPTTVRAIVKYFVKMSADFDTNAGIVKGVSSVPTSSSACLRSLNRFFISFK